MIFFQVKEKSGNFAISRGNSTHRKLLVMSSFPICSVVKQVFKFWWMRGAGSTETKGSWMFSYMMHKHAPHRSDQKSGKWLKVREFCYEN